jgi:putative hydrolase of the HAD superfamily
MHAETTSSSPALITHDSNGFQDSAHRVRPVDLETIAFDADDTLWHNEDGFHHVEQQFAALVSPHLTTPVDPLEVLAAKERENVTVFGYGVKSFTFSMIEVASALTKARLSATAMSEMVHEIVGLGRWLLTRETVVFEDSMPVLEQLAGRYRLLLVSKGDTHHQMSKVHESGLRSHFDHVEIVAEKDPSTYRALAEKYSFDLRTMLMVGNSVKSDILPVLDVGANAVHIPYTFTWALERAEITAEHPGWTRYWRLNRLGELPSLLDQTVA